ncbi:MAG: serine protease [Bdellovibrionota bacterium]
MKTKFQYQLNRIFLVGIFLMGFLSVLKSHADQGFYPVHKIPVLPEWVLEKSKSVFRIVMRVGPEMAPKVDDEILKKCENPQNTEQKLNCDHIKKCTSGQPCHLVYQGAGTAFLTGDGSEVVTAWHVVQPNHLPALILLNGFLSKKPLAERQKTLQNMRPEFVLINSKGKVVFDTGSERELPIYANFGDPNSFTKMHMDQNPRNVLVDFVKIKINRSIGKGLKFLDLEYKPDSNDYFAMGYPQKTLRKSKMNSNGFDLFLSKGKLVSSSNYLDQIEWKSIEQRDSEAKFFSNEYLNFFDIDVVPGNSGGPIFNSDGDVVGIAIATASSSDLYKKSTAVAARKQWMDSYNLY